MLIIKVAISLIAFLILFRVGLSVLRGLATPIPEPPPPGELRKVNLCYRCSLCGTEARITIATEEHPDPPRHCMDDMELVTANE